MVNIKKLVKCLFFVLSLCLLTGCSMQNNAVIAFEKKQLHNGDAKFYENSIITNVDNHLYICDMDGNYRQYDDIKCNWLDVIPDEGLMVYSNFDNETGLIQFDDKMDIINHTLLWSHDKLNIDPAIIKIGNMYYLTSTEIDGTVNNADIDGENGIYTIKLFCSSDLQSWDYITDVISHKNNLEDIKLFNKDNKLCIIYEKEIVDKGNSSICAIEAKDSSCIDWGEEKILLKADSDHEPANIMSSVDGIFLFYSSDFERPGESYMGSNLYYAKYDWDFNLIEKNIKIDTEIKDGQLLYDVCILDDEIYFLSEVNYLTDSDLAVQKSKITAALKGIQ